jgi:hypothetical protein
VGPAGTSLDSSQRTLVTVDVSGTVPAAPVPEMPFHIAKGDVGPVTLHGGDVKKITRIYMTGDDGKDVEFVRGLLDESNAKDPTLTVVVPAAISKTAGKKVPTIEYGAEGAKWDDKVLSIVVE